MVEELNARLMRELGASRREGDQVRQQVIARSDVSRSFRRAASWSGWCARRKCSAKPPGRPRLLNYLENRTVKMGLGGVHVGTACALRSDGYHIGVALSNIE